MNKKTIFYVTFFFFTFFYILNLALAQETSEKVVMIVASENFRDEELLIPKDMLETNRFKVILASSSLAPARGELGTVVKPDILLEDINIEEYKAVVFIGGSGASEFWDNPVAHKIAVQAKDADIVVAAICSAPITLAKSGILKDKKATVWSKLAEDLKEYGGKYSGRQLQVDGNIITAVGPQVSVAFADAIIKVLVRRR